MELVQSVRNRSLSGQSIILSGGLIDLTSAFETPMNIERCRTLEKYTAMDDGKYPSGRHMRP